MNNCACGDEVFAKSMCKRCYNRYWRTTFPDKMRQAKKRWNNNNKDKVRQHAANGRKKYPTRGKKGARTITGRFSYSKSKCKILNQVWELTLSEYSYLISLPCFYCAGPLPETSKGIDRLDSTLGYTTTNVVPCCKHCNTAKSNMSVDEFIQWVVKVYNQLKPPPFN